MRDVKHVRIVNQYIFVLYFILMRVTSNLHLLIWAEIKPVPLIGSNDLLLNHVNLMEVKYVLQ